MSMYAIADAIEKLGKDLTRVIKEKNQIEKEKLEFEKEKFEFNKERLNKNNSNETDSLKGKKSEGLTEESESCVHKWELVKTSYDSLALSPIHYYVCSNCGEVKTKSMGI